MRDDALPTALGQLERELAYYRRECNDLGARLLRLQEEQSQAFREARRSRTVAKLIREAYRLADHDSGPDEIGGPMLEIIVENAICDGAALLHEGANGEFTITHGVGASAEGAPRSMVLPGPPAFFFTTSRTPIEPPAYELTAVLRLPYVLWAYDRPSGTALILGNRLESNVSRPFESRDQELVEGALSVYIDVLLRKRAEFELRSAKAAAEQARDSRARFLATLTHELRTPLSAVVGFAELMVPDSRYDLSLDDRQRYAVHILEAGRHLLQLADGILEFASLERAMPFLVPAWQPVGGILASAVSIATGIGHARSIGIQMVLPDRPFDLLVDRTRFLQVLHNLLGNAVKFSPDGGQVDIIAEMRGDGTAVLAIRDAGIGMQASDIPRALEPFQQVGVNQGQGFGGTGLGLPIAKGLTEAHGGKLEIESAPGRGTMVRVTVPPERVRASRDG